MALISSKAILRHKQLILALDIPLFWGTVLMNLETKSHGFSLVIDFIYPPHKRVFIIITNNLGNTYIHIHVYVCTHIPYINYSKTFFIFLCNNCLKCKCITYAKYICMYSIFYIDMYILFPKYANITNKIKYQCLSTEMLENYSVKFLCIC